MGLRFEWLKSFGFKCVKKRGGGGGKEKKKKQTHTENWNITLNCIFKKLRKNEKGS